MIVLIYGGSSSGKSAFAEDYVCKSNIRNKIYLATMSASDEESKSRIKRHRDLRNGKGFVTVEQPVDINQSVFEIEEIDSIDFSSTDQSGDKPIILLECMSNLVANEMFREGQINSAKYCVDKIFCEIKELEEACSTLVIVSNNIFEDGGEYDEFTKEYLRALGKINQKIMAISGLAYEVVVGIGLKVKG